MGIKTTSCCGVREFSGLQKDPVEVVNYFCKYLFEGGQCAFILYTDPVEFENGEALTDFIREFKLGDVTETPVRHNPNSDRDLKAYLFAPDLKTLKTWYDKQPKREPFKVGDMVVGNDKDRYNVTRKGWTGKVISVSGGEYITVEGTANSSGRGQFDVESQYFDLVKE